MLAPNRTPKVTGKTRQIAGGGITHLVPVVVPFLTPERSFVALLKSERDVNICWGYKVR